MTNDCDRPGIHAAEKLVMVFLVPMALWNLAAHVSLIAGFSFKTLSIGYSAVLLSVLAVSVRRALRPRTGPDAQDHEEKAQTYVLACLCLIGAALSFVSIRPTWDDAIYIGGRAVFFAEFDSVPLDLNFHHKGLLDFPIRYPLEFAQTIHLLWGYVAYISGLSCVDVFHILVPVLGCMFIPVVHYLAVSRFCDDRWATLVGVAGIFAFLCIDGGRGEYTRAFGNWAFVGIWLGKSILMSIVIPIFIAFSMDWFRNGNLHNWYKLFLIGMAASGLSGSALFMIPLLALALAGAHVCSQGMYRGIIRILAGYLASLVYLIAVALYIRIITVPSSMNHLGFEYGFPDSFWGQWGLIFGSPLSVTGIAFFASIGLALILSARVQRRFLAAWIAVLAIIALNPIMMPFVVKYLTTLNAYWRLFFILPFPLTLGIAVAGIAVICRVASLKAEVAACTVILTFGLLFNLVDYCRDVNERTAIFSKICFGLLAHKISPRLEQEVKQIIAASVPGVMIAPMRYSAVIPLFTNSIPQVAVRHFLLMHASIEHGRRGEAESKIAAINHLSGTNEQGLRDLEDLLVKPELKNVVLDAKVKGNKSLTDTLARHGLAIRLEGQSFVLFTRP